MGRWKLVIYFKWAIWFGIQYEYETIAIFLPFVMIMYCFGESSNASIFGKVFKIKSKSNMSREQGKREE
jgi:hypothetical protein